MSRFDLGIRKFWRSKCGFIVLLFCKIRIGKVDVIEFDICDVSDWFLGRCYKKINGFILFVSRKWMELLNGFYINFVF